MKGADQAIHFIITGGTIDSYYDGIKDTVVPNKHSAIHDFFRILRMDTPVEFTEICMKDSRDIANEDRKKILDAIEKCPCKRIIVTHGTYTMPDTARYLEANLKRRDKTIVLTGSFIPLVGFSPSDAPFSLGFAVSQVQKLKSGVHICIQGKTLKSSEALKEIKEGKFISIFEKKK